MSTELQLASRKSDLSLSSLVHQGSKIINNGKIKTLPSLPVTCISAPAITQIIKPIWCEIALDFTGGAYTADTGSSWMFMYEGGTFGSTDVSVPILMDSALASATKQFTGYTILLPNLVTNASGFENIPVSTLVHSQNLIAGKALQILDQYTGVNDYTDGDDTNTAIVCVGFLLFDLLFGRNLTMAESGWNESSRSFINL